MLLVWKSCLDGWFNSTLPTKDTLYFVPIYIMSIEIINAAKDELREEKERALQSAARDLLRRKEEYEGAIKLIDEDLKKIEEWILPEKGRRNDCY